MANGKTWERNCHTDSRLLTQSLGDREMIMNGKWKTVKLGDVFTLQMGKTPDRNKLSYFSKVGNKWISIADITKSDKFIKETKECITDVAVQESGIKKIPQNTVIMSFKLSIGKTAITTEECYSNEAIMAFLPNGLCDFDNNYLYHLFSNKNWSEGSNKAVKGITLNKESLSNVYIPLPPLETQQKIAAVLDKVQKIISESKAILEKYDTLIKSRFIEMFGDKPVESGKWKVEKLEDVCDLITDGTHKTPNYQQKGIRFISAKNIINGKIDLTDTKFITEEEYKQIQKRCRVEKNDVLLTKSGSLGSSAIIDFDIPIGLFESLAVIKYKRNLLNGIFVKELLSAESSQKHIYNGVKGIAIKHLHLNVIAALKIPIPPISLQNNFAAFVQQIDKSKFAVQKSLEKAETLYKSLMQEYFA